MRAVTVVSPEYEAVGQEAAARFWRFARIKADVLRCRAEDSHRVKLEALRDAAKSGWRFFFDADWWLTGPCQPEIRALLGPWLAGAPIPGTMADYQARDFGYDPRCRVTSGFLAFDPTLPMWDKVLALALKLQAAMDPNRDEVFLNAAAHHFGLPVRVIDSGWNWYMRQAYPYQPPRIRALHAGGFPVAERHAVLHAATSAPPPPNWSLDEAELVWLERVARVLVKRGMRRVVEFGPGASTRVLLAAGCDVTSCETDKRAFCMHAVDFGNQKNLTLRFTKHEPLLSGLDVPADWCFVDGPMGSLLVDGKARWHQLVWSATRCPFIILHDTKREGEKRSMSALGADHWDVTAVESPRGLAIISRGSKSLIDMLRRRKLLAV